MHPAYRNSRREQKLDIDLHTTLIHMYINAYTVYVHGFCLDKFETL